MNSYEFYKSLYDRELKRRIDLDKAINLPLTLLSIIVAANSYIIRESNWNLNTTNVILEKVITLATAIGIGISIFYLIKSFNNFFKGFAYRNIGLTKEVRQFENRLYNYNKKVSETDKIDFENTIVDKLTGITDDHIFFNDKRSRDLYWAKTFLIVCIATTLINFIIISFKYLKL